MPNKSLIKPSFNKTAIEILNKRYLMKDEEGNVIESPSDMLWRVAIAIAKADKKFIKKPESNSDKYIKTYYNKKILERAKQFYDVMAKGEFLPNSPTLMNAGTSDSMLSACFVLPIEDSMESIFETIKNTAMIHKRGGGTGFSFSHLRPMNDIVKSTSGVSSGPISFMKVFDSATEVVKQAGKRRGANMGILRIDHPDIIDFIKVKSDLNKLNNFNLSIAITDDFMIAVRENTDYDIKNPRNNEVVAQYNAREVFDQIVKQAWTSGEPGLVFIDEINRRNPTSHHCAIEATNPCGELPLEPNNSCNLGSINVSKILNADNEIDFDKLGELVDLGVHFLDNVIEVNHYPLEIIGETTRLYRKIGLGIMGFADMLMKMEIPYTSETALKLADTLMEFINKRAYQYSIKLGEERGIYPVYYENLPRNIYVKLSEPCRNAVRTTIAPTGTISILAGCSSGIEPIFSLAFVRNIMDNDEFFEVNPVFDMISKINDFHSDDIIRQLAKEGTVKHVDGIPDEHKLYMESAHDISPLAHVKMQAVFQKHIDNSISKTINFSKDATEDDVRDAYLTAYDMGCKGITIYRDGCRDNQVLNIGDKSSSKSEKIIEKRIKKNRPKTLSGSTIQLETGCGKIYVTINEDEEGNPFEVFNSIGKAGGCSACQSESIGKLISLAFRSGQSPESIIKQLIGISCHRPFGFGENTILSCSDAIAKALKSYMEIKNDVEIKIEEKETSGGNCPECGGTISFESGCQMCHSCGWSACS